MRAGGHRAPDVPPPPPAPEPALEGVVYLAGTGTLPSLILEIARSGPVVLVDEQIPGFELPAAVSDCRRGAREVAIHVLDHRRLAVIGGPEPLWTAERRLAGYREAAAATGMDPGKMPVYVGDYRKQSGAELAARAPPRERPPGCCLPTT